MFPKAIDALNARITDLERGLRAAIQALEYAEASFDLHPEIAAAMWAHCDGGLIGAPDIRTLLAGFPIIFDFEQLCLLLQADPQFCDVEIQQPISDDQAPCEVYFSLKDKDSEGSHIFSLYLDVILNYDITLLSIGDSIKTDIYLESSPIKGLMPENVLRLLKTWLDDNAFS